MIQRLVLVRSDMYRKMTKGMKLSVRLSSHWLLDADSESSGR